MDSTALQKGLYDSVSHFRKEGWISATVNASLRVFQPDILLTRQASTCTLWRGAIGYSSGNVAMAWRSVLPDKKHVYQDAVSADFCVMF
ncbi:unnamed protein product [Arctogadus glacialis]